MSIQWALLFFAVFAGMSMGLLTFIAYQEIRGGRHDITIPGLVIALVLLVVGGISSALHMGHPEQAFYVLSNIGSGIAQELIGTVVALATILAFLYVVARRKRSAVKPVAVVALVVGLVFPFVMGHAYLMGARPAWNTWFLPVMFVGDALAMGWCMAFALASMRKADADEIALARKAAVIGIAVFAASLALWLTGVLVAYEPAPSRSLGRILSGDLAVVFWLGVVAAGIVVPLLTGILGGRYLEGGSAASASGTVEAAKAGNPTLVLAVVGVTGILIASVAVRVIMYTVGTSVQSFIY